MRSLLSCWAHSGATSDANSTATASCIFCAKNVNKPDHSSFSHPRFHESEYRWQLLFSCIYAIISESRPRAADREHEADNEANSQNTPKSLWAFAINLQRRTREAFLLALNGLCKSLTRPTIIACRPCTLHVVRRLLAWLPPLPCPTVKTTTSAHGTKHACLVCADPATPRHRSHPLSSHRCWHAFDMRAHACYSCESPVRLSFLGSMPVAVSPCAYPC